MTQAAPFSQVLAQGPVLIEFYRQQCGACKLMTPAVKDVAQRFGVKFLMADTTQNPELGEKLKIDSVPTVIMFRDGEEQGRLVGRQPATVIEEFIRDIR